MRSEPYSTFRENSLELVELSSTNTVLYFSPNLMHHSLISALHLASAAAQTSTVSVLITHPECNITLTDINELTAEDLALKTDVRNIFVKYKENSKTQNVETALVACN